MFAELNDKAKIFLIKAFFLLDGTFIFTHVGTA